MKQPTMLWKQTSVFNNGLIFSIYCGKNPTIEAKQEVTQQLLKFIEDQIVTGQTLFQITVTTVDAPPSVPIPIRHPQTSVKDEIKK